MLVSSTSVCRASWEVFTIPSLIIANMFAKRTTAAAKLDVVIAASGKKALESSSSAANKFVAHEKISLAWPLGIPAAFSANNPKFSRSMAFVSSLAFPFSFLKRKTLVRVSLNLSKTAWTCSNCHGNMEMVSKDDKVEKFADHFFCFRNRISSMIIE